MGNIGNLWGKEEIGNTIDIRKTWTNGIDGKEREIRKLWKMKATDEKQGKLGSRK